ncbi:tRNA (N(6)-L-threonylcarbamoyladenosine(37)-C(2))-methylthiotransferase MtaB [Clostridia bacterium]|nr:tRNA (N(6)-L-threonylcarbamoyladenosine(37)-C(2))-methylthiotransferase MtaB [Clostridia bacterium]
MKKVAAVTLGCKVNAYDTEAILTILSGGGYEVVDFSETADIYIVNTCTVTNTGDRKSRQMIGRARRQNPNAVIVAAGCYAQTRAEELSEIADIVIGTEGRGDILQVLETRLNRVMSLREIKVFEKLPVQRLSGRTRAYVKIQEGCDNFCSYCIIPYARGNPRSRDIGDAIVECRNLAENNFKEIVLTGININSYGKDLVDTDLPKLLRRINDIDGICRIRLSSLSPVTITEEFLRELPKKVCDHFHLSLQSGCDRTLRNMNRRYDTKFYENAVNNIRRYYKDAAITTDIIVGFPEETDYDFCQSMEFCQKMELAKIHVFPFSAKEGTRAFSMGGQVSESVKKERTSEFLKLAKALRGNFLDKYAGKTMPVLFEKEGEGHTANYILVKTGTYEKNTISNIALTRENMV